MRRSRMPGKRTLASALRDARLSRGMSLREVERRTGIGNAHLSQLETGTIVRPEPALVWEPRSSTTWTSPSCSSSPAAQGAGTRAVSG